MVAERMQHNRLDLEPWMGLRIYLITFFVSECPKVMVNYTQLILGQQRIFAWVAKCVIDPVWRDIAVLRLG